MSTERKIPAPQEADEFIGSLYEHAAVGIEQVASDGRLLMVNAALCRMLGYSRSELLGKTFDEIIAPDDRAQETRLLKKMLAGEHKCHESEKRYLHCNGSLVWASVTCSVVRDRAGSTPHCLCLVRDITKPRLASSQFRLAIDSAPTAMVILDEDGKIILVNSHAEKLFGYRSEELLQQPVDILIPESFRKTYPQLSMDFSRHPVERPMGHGRDLEARRKDGTHFPVEIGLHPVESGNDQWVLASIVDISERKRTEKALRESEEKLALLLESTAEGIYGVDRENRVTFCNPACLHMLGYQRADELIGKNMHELIHHTRPDGSPYPAEECPVVQSIRTGEASNNPNEILWRADGKSFNAEYWSSPQRRDGQVVAAVVAFIDSTERKRTEEALKKSEEKFSKAFRQSPMSLTITSVKDHRYIDVNETFEHVSGWRREEIIGRTPLDIGLYVDPAQRVELANRALTEGGFRDQEVRFRTRDGNVRVAQVSGELIELDGELCLLNVANDITEYKRVEEALKKSEEKFSRAFRQSPIALTLTSARDHCYIEVNETFERISGYTRKETLGRTPFDLGIWAEPAKRVDLVKRIMAEGCIRDYEVAFHPKDGSIRIGLGSAELIEIDGEPFVLSSIADITERKRAEQALRESENKFRTVFRSAPAGMVMMSAEGRFLAANNAFCDFLGYSEKELLDRDILSVTHPDDQAISLQAMDQALADEFGSQRSEKRYLHKNGQILWGELITIAIRGSEGRLEYFVSQILNMTERKRVERELQQRNAELREGQRLAQIGSWLWDLRSNTVTWSEELYRIHGLDPGTPPLRGNELYRLFTEDSWRRLSAAREEARLTGVVDALDLEVMRPDGSKRWIATRGEAVRDATGAIVQLRGTVQDITERKRAERALRESEERFRVVANAAPVMIWMSGTDKLCTYFNEPWLEFTGRPLEAELGNGWAEDVHPDDLPKCLETYTQSFDSRIPFRMEYRLRRHDGEYRWIEDTGVPLTAPDGSFAGYIGSCVDITDRKKAEEALRGVSRKLIEAEEKERRRIARELHDDINQRLAMLAIEIQRLKDTPRPSAAMIRARTKELFARTTEISTDVQLLSHRLHSSSLEYLGLAPAMKGFCREFAKHQKVEVDFTHSNVPGSLPPEVALGLFRVLQEALRNAVKHSGVRKFEAGLLGVRDGIQLMIRDSGKGFDPDATESGNGLGLVSMRERVNLLKGTISIVSKPKHGTEITVRIPLVAETGASQHVSA